MLTRRSPSPSTRAAGARCGNTAHPDRADPEPTAGRVHTQRGVGTLGPARPVEREAAERHEAEVTQRIRDRASRSSRPAPRHGARCLPRPDRAESGSSSTGTGGVSAGEHLRFVPSRTFTLIVSHRSARGCARSVRMT